MSILLLDVLLQTHSRFLIGDLTISIESDFFLTKVHLNFDLNLG